MQGVVGHAGLGAPQDSVVSSQLGVGNAPASVEQAPPPPAEGGGGVELLEQPPKIIGKETAHAQPAAPTTAQVQILIA